VPNLSMYSVGGTVQAGGGLYIPRKADEELLRLCRNSTFAYVLYARQVGKSSLMVRAAERLRELDVLPVFLDLTRFGVSVTVDQWYLGQLFEATEQLGLETDFFEWWGRPRQSVGQPQRMITFFRDVLLREVTKSIVIFIDEIDTTLSLPFVSDDYFAAIRAIYNARVTTPEFSRLSFVLTGVASPIELIRDPRRTPFNIGETVKLDDFTIEEAMPLAAGFGLPPEDARQVLACILKWSGGHPYLTQRICSAVAEKKRTSWSEGEIDLLVKMLFLNTDTSVDNNLLFVNDMLTRRMPAELDPRDVLMTYRDILRGQPVLDYEGSRVNSHLKLSGVVKSQDGRLHVRNRIYREAFSERWISGYLPAPSLKGLMKSWWPPGRRP
jgi:hypothetical protein